MLDFIKNMLGYKSLERRIEDMEFDVKSRPAPVVVSGISRCIVDIEKFKPVSISIEQRSNSAYIRLDRLDTDNKITSTFYEYSQEDHIRIMNEFKQYLFKCQLMNTQV